MIYLYYQTAAIFLLLLLLISYFIYDYYSYKKTLNKIPLRIHVNGTRGKSSVTRLIAGGLRAHGLVVCAKTTGSAAQFIEPSGREYTISRRAPANIREVASFIRRAVNEYHAEAIVVECMAVTPEYQSVLENKFLRAHILALTNIRHDHEDVMGRGILSITKALAGSLPEHNTLVTNADSCELLRQIDSLKTTKVISDLALINESELASFPYEVIEENVQLALTVCLQVGVPRDIAVQGMIASLPDIGNLSINHWQLEDRYLQLINALAANDPESTLLLWHKYIKKDDNVIVLLNCRANRKERTRQLVESFIPIHNGLFILSGDTGFAYNTLLSLGMNKERILTMPQVNKQNLLKLDITNSEKINCIFAAGNLKGCDIFATEVL